MADGSFPNLVSKDRNSNAVGNPLFVQISDGTDSALVDGSGNLNVILAPNSGVDIGDVDVTSVIPGVGATNLGKAEDAVHASGDTGVFVLTRRIDAAASSAGASGDYATFNTNATGDLYVTLDGESVTTTNTANQVDDSAFTIATDEVTGIGCLADETAPDSVDEGDIGIPRMTLDRKILTRVVGASDANRLDIDASGHAQVDLAAVSVTAVPVSATSAANTETNPLFVQVVSGVVSGTEQHDYDTAAAVASDAVSNHDVTVTGSTTFLLKSVMWAGSGNVKVEVQTGPVLSLVTVAVGFLNGRNGDFQQMFFDPPVEVPDTSTGTIRVIRTNRQGAATDVYSTIIGTEV